MNDGQRVLGRRYYELKNHLGNVMTVVSDDITRTESLTRADVVSVSDYYPFGLEHHQYYSVREDRNEAAAQRYGFNGKERDNSFGTVHYDYGFRIYNPEIGKFLSVDPLTKSYPMLTPYQFASNSPIQAIDLDGLEAYHYTLDMDSDEAKSQLTSEQEIIEYGSRRNQSLMNKTKVVNPRQEYYVTLTYQDYDVTEALAIPVIRRIKKQFDSRELAENATVDDFLDDIDSEAYWRAIRQGFAGGIGSRPMKRRPFAGSPKSRVVNSSVTVNGINSFRRLEGTAKGKVAVIGRGQVKRVNKFAEGIGAETWKGFDPHLPDEVNLKNNRAWIQDKVDKGYTIYDVGLDPNYSEKDNYNKHLTLKTMIKDNTIRWKPMLFLEVITNKDARV